MACMLPLQEKKKPKIPQHPCVMASQSANRITGGVSSGLVCYPLRVHPGTELRHALLQFVQEKNLQGAFIMTCVGSVTKATIRMAYGSGIEKIKTFDKHFEILSLVGTLSGGHGHLHITLGDHEGHVLGGHVVGDLIVYTTAEVMIGDCADAQFGRQHDEDSGWPELTITKKDADEK